MVTFQETSAVVNCTSTEDQPCLLHFWILSALSVAYMTNYHIAPHHTVQEEQLTRPPMLHKDFVRIKAQAVQMTYNLICLHC
jgi:hypothetical protein